jgi:thiamine transport system ATP-binding protein
MLHGRGLEVQYGTTTAVAGVDLDVAPGTILAVLGPSGCGKSTLLRAIAGLEPLTGGRLTWDDDDLGAVPVHRRGFGMMFQDHVLFPHLDVGENVAYGLRRATGARANRRQSIDARVRELLSMVGLDGYERRRVDELSGGEAQRVALARALAPRPRLLMLDEPLSSIDRDRRDLLLDDLRRIVRETGTAAIHVTHDHDEALMVADRVAVMRAGRFEQCATPVEVWTRPVDAFVATFLGANVLAGEAIGRPLGSLWALRPDALTLDPAGPIAATVDAIAFQRGFTQLQCRLPAGDPFTVWLPHDAAATVAIGGHIRLAIGRDAAVALPRV